MIVNEISLAQDGLYVNCSCLEYRDGLWTGQLHQEEDEPAGGGYDGLHHPGEHVTCLVLKTHHDNTRVFTELSN